MDERLKTECFLYLSLQSLFLVKTINISIKNFHVFLVNILIEHLDVQVY